MTLIELLIAMVVMGLGISALVAGFSSGLLSIGRARTASTVGTLADKQMELYRQAPFLSPSLAPHDLSAASGAQTGTDGRTYWVGSTIAWTCIVGAPHTTTSAAQPTCAGTPTPASRPVKLITIEVHKGPTSSGALAFIESATFDSSTG